MTNNEAIEKLKKFNGLFKSLTYLRAELNILGYDYIDMSIRAGDNIDNPPKIPERLNGLNINSLRTVSPSGDWIEKIKEVILDYYDDVNNTIDDIVMPKIIDVVTSLRTTSPEGDVDELEIVRKIYKCRLCGNKLQDGYCKECDVMQMFIPSEPVKKLDRNWIEKARKQFSKMEYYGVDSEIFSKGEPYSKETFIHAIQDNLPKPEGDVDAIMEDLMYYRIEVTNDRECSLKYFVEDVDIEKILTKHLSNLPKPEGDVDDIMSEILSYKITGDDDGKSKETIDGILNHIVRPVLTKHLGDGKKDLKFKAKQRIEGERGYDKREQKEGKLKRAKK